MAPFDRGRSSLLFDKSDIALVVEIYPSEPTFVDQRGNIEFFDFRNVFRTASFSRWLVIRASMPYSATSPSNKWRQHLGAALQREYTRLKSTRLSH